MSPAVVIGALALVAALFAAAYGPLYAAPRDAKADGVHGERHEPDADLPESRDVREVPDAG